MKNKITTEQLAIMIQKGFKKVHDKMDRLIHELKWDLKDDINDLRLNQSNYVTHYKSDKLAHKVERLEKKIN